MGDPRAAVSILLLLALATVVGVSIWSSGPESPPSGGAHATPGPPTPERSDGPAPGRTLAFVDVTERAGLSFATFAGVRADLIIEDLGPGVAVGDVDGDGDLDIYAVAVNALATFKGPASGRASNALFLGDGRGGFVRRTDSGAEFQGVGMGAVLADLDDDGALDLVVTNFGPDRLYRGLGDGRFEDVTKGSGLGDPGFSAGPAMADFDGDGDLDIYLPRYVRFDPRLGPASPSASASVAHHGRDERARRVLAAEDARYVTPPPYGILPVNFRPLANRVLRNDGALTFTDITDASGAADPRGRSLQAVAADFDGDGRADVFVANDVSLNRLFLGRGDGTFEDASERLGLADPRGAMGVAMAEVGGGPRPDLFVTNFSTDTHGLWVDTGGAGGWGVRPAEGWAGLTEPTFGDVGFGTVAADFDLDGRTDLFVANGHVRSPRAKPHELGPQQDRLFLGGEEGFVEAVGALPQAARASRGAVAADLDGDGDDDLLIADREGLRMLRNDQRTGHGWLKVRGARPGSTVRVVGEGRVLGHRPMLVGGSYLSGPPAELTFGLGRDEDVTVEASLPGGRVFTKRLRGRNQRMDIEP